MYFYIYFEIRVHVFAEHKKKNQSILRHYHFYHSLSFMCVHFAFMIEIVSLHWCNAALINKTNTFDHFYQILDGTYPHFILGISLLVLRQKKRLFKLILK